MTVNDKLAEFLGGEVKESNDFSETIVDLLRRNVIDVRPNSR
jgi:hypothetical protein